MLDFFNLPSIHFLADSGYTYPKIGYRMQVPIPPLNFMYIYFYLYCLKCKMIQFFEFSRFFCKKAGKFKLLHNVGNQQQLISYINVLYICMKTIMCASRKSTLYLHFRGKQEYVLFKDQVYYFQKLRQIIINFCQLF